MTAAWPSTARADSGASIVFTDCTLICSALELGRCDSADARVVRHANTLGREVVAARLNPFVQTPDAFMHSNSWLPASQPAELTRVRDVIALIRRSPVFETDNKITAVEFRQQIK